MTHDLIEDTAITIYSPWFIKKGLTGGGTAFFFFILLVIDSFLSNGAYRRVRFVRARHIQACHKHRMLTGAGNAGLL